MKGWLTAENEFQAKRGTLSTPFRTWERSGTHSRPRRT